MLELKSKTTAAHEGLLAKKVQFFVNDSWISFQGSWSWELPAEELFCSDVMVAMHLGNPAAVKCLIHPDDVPAVRTALSANDATALDLQFRVITSWGHVVTIRGKGRFQAEQDEAFLQNLQQKEIEEFTRRQLQKEQLQKAYLQLSTYQFAERLSGQGVWWYNTVHNEAVYSDNLFRILGVPPQSLNTHLYTFMPFIHPEDKEVVTDIFEKAFKAGLPLDLEFRILTHSSEQKYIAFTTRWMANDRGEQILYGVVTDKTEEVRKEREWTDLRDDLEIRAGQLRNSEAMARTANWHINLYTRHTVFSDNTYRIYGLKPQAVNPGALINFVHPDDHEMVVQATKRSYNEHIVPDLEYRIIRPDGKIRHLVQKGKMIINSQKEMILVGTTKDVTERVVAARKIKELEQAQQQHLLAARQVEEAGGMGSIIWDLNSGEMKWSEGFYTLVGYKSSTVQPSQKLLLNFIHPEDRQLFTAHLTGVMNEHAADELAFRMIRKGETRYVKAQFQWVHEEDSSLILNSFTDYTDQYYLEQKLSGQVRLADQIGDASLDSVYVTDTNNYIIRWNARCETAYGIKREKAIGKNLFELFPQFKSTVLLEAYHKALAGESHHFKEQPGWVQRGILDISIVPVKDSRGEVMAVITTIHDGTQEYELKAQLSGRLKFIERFLEASIDRIIVLDKNMNYQYWNKRAEEYYNVSKEEVIGRNILDVSPGLLNDPTYAEFRRALKGETVHIPAVQNLEARKGYFETFLIPIRDDKDEVSSVLWIVHNLSNEYKLQQEQKRADDILNKIEEGCVELDSEGIFRYINRQAEELWNISREDLLGRSVWDTFTHNVDAEGYNIIAQSLNEKVPVQQEYFSSSSNRWIHMSATPSAEGAIVLFYDIQEIKESKQLQEAIFNASMYGIVLFRPLEDDRGEITDFEVVLTNKVATGWAGKDLAGSRYADVFPAVKDNGIFEGFKEVVRTGEPMDQEFYYEGQGLQNWYRITAVKLGNDILSTAEDITDRKKAEEHIQTVNRQLQESQQYAQQIVDATPDIITIYDLQKRDSIYMNRTIGTVLGYSLEELKEMGFKGRSEKIIYPDDLPALLAFNKSMEGATDQEVRSIEYRVRCKDGEIKWFKNRSKVFRRSGEGVPTHTISVLQNITEEKMLTRQLRERTTFVEHLIDASVDRIFAVDSHYLVRAWNRKCEEYYHYKKEEVLGRSLLDLFPRVKSNERFIRALQEAMAGRESHAPAEKEMYLDIVSERFFIPVNTEEGQEPVVLCLLHDVTHDFMAREELRVLNRVLEQKNRELQDKHDEIASFAFVSSHDLKEPLRKIHTFSDWLLQKEEENVSATGKKYLVKLNESVRRLEMLIEDILVLTKIHSEKKKSVPVDLNTLLVDVREDLQDKIRATGATLTAGVLPVVDGHPNQLAILFKNLLSNALKFQPPEAKPEIRIEAGIVKGAELHLPGVPEDKEYFHVSFADNGLGFNIRYAKKIFQVFQRLHSVQEFPGTGMGLAICRKIMDNHEGFITAESEEGKGATFHCYFPTA